jgi:hypothetical protein
VQTIVYDSWNLLEKIPFVMVKHVNRELNIEAHNIIFVLFYLYFS